MSTFEDHHYRWRETYFVLFHSSKRPTLKRVKETLSALGPQYALRNLSADDRGRMDSLTLLAPDDFAALDICYTSGPEVLEQGASLADEVRASLRETDEQGTVRRIEQCDARFDVLHFEQVPDSAEDEEEAEEMLDPSALLLVLDALAKLTDGIAVDPQAGAILS